MNQIVGALRYLFLLFLALFGSATVLAFAYLLGQDPPAQAVEFSPGIVITQEPNAPSGKLLVTIHDAGGRQLLQAEPGVVADALAQAGVILAEADRVSPGFDTPLTPDMHITIRRAGPLTVSIDGQLVQIRSAHSSASEVLADAGIILGPLDYTRPGPEQALQAGDIIEVVRVREEIQEEDEPLPFETEWQPSDEFEIDTEGLVQPGQSGILRRQWRIRYENGTPVERTLEREWIEQPPQPEIMGYGTKIVVRVVDTPAGAYEYWRVVRMRVTSYTASSSGKPPDHPAYGITASGLGAGTGIVAVDRNVIPFRSWVYVPGYGQGFAGDTGGGVIGRWIDLGYYEDEFVPWSGYVDVYYLTPIPELDRINFRIPTELP